MEQSSSSGSEAYDSSFSDPDYTGASPQRRTRKNINVMNSATDNPMQNGGHATLLERATVEENPRRKRRRTLLRRRPRTSNKTNRKELKNKKTILSWLIDQGVICEDMRVFYLDEGRKIQNMQGKIKRDGVLCDCCNNVITVYEFGEHANGRDLKNPYAHIYCSTGEISLLTSMIQAWKNQPEELALCGFNLVEPRKDAADISDDACMICADGGNLICCEQCPCTFHPSCMSIEKIPQEEWLCPFCTCKFCGIGHPGELHECKQCERRYHSDCFFLRQPFYPDCPVTTFCGNSCKGVFSEIQKRYLGVRHELGDGFTWWLVRLMLEGEPDSNLDLHTRSVCNAKVAVAWRVMDELFLPNIDGHTATNIIQGVVYNRESNFRRVNFRGFYTAILEKNDEIISVASIRVHGTKIAEMPFVGTRERFRGQGMLRKLLTEIESALRFLKVENLVIPSVPELVPMWINKYEFSHIGNDLMKELINFNTLMFPSAIRLHKSLVAHATGPSVVASAAIQVEAKNNETDHAGKYPAKKARFDLNLEPPEDDDA